jgi:myo-inositol-1-phosphate synthase
VDGMYTLITYMKQQCKAKVLEAGLLNSVKAELEAVVPMKAAFDQNYAKNLTATHVKEGTRYELAQAVMKDIKDFQRKK